MLASPMLPEDVSAVSLTHADHLLPLPLAPGDMADPEAFLMALLPDGTRLSAVDIIPRGRNWKPPPPPLALRACR